MIKFWVTTFWFMKVAWLWCFMIHRNQKVVTQNFVIEPTGDKYFSTSNNMTALCTLLGTVCLYVSARVWALHRMHLLDFKTSKSQEKLFSSTLQLFWHKEQATSWVILHWTVAFLPHFLSGFLSYCLMAFLQKKVCRSREVVNSSI